MSLKNHKHNRIPEGIYTATVISNEDAIYSGRITIRIGEFTGPKDEGRICVLCSPFGGTEEIQENADDPTIYGDNSTGKAGTSKTYGIWPQPPGVGSIIAVCYAPGYDQAIFLGTLIYKDRNHMMGGRASAENYGPDPVAPVGEKNIYDENDKVTKPLDQDFSDVLKEQGLDKDYTRGHSMSSARRESPSRVFGITTKEGHVVSMDDGTEEGDSNNIRIRTRSGAQILMDDTNKMIYINNHAGNSWIEMDEEGNIDIYAKGNISMHTEENFNVHAKGDINMQADGGVNLRAAGADGFKIEAQTGDYDMYAAKNFQVQAGINGNVKCGASYKETAARIDMNGPVAADAARIFDYNLVDNKNILISAADRVPEHEPWEGHTTVQEDFTTAKGKTN